GGAIQIGQGARVIAGPEIEKRGVEEQQRIGRTQSKALFKDAGALGVTRTLERFARLRQIALHLLVNFLVHALNAFEGISGFDKGFRLGKFCASFEKIADCSRVLAWAISALASCSISFL